VLVINCHLANHRWMIDVSDSLPLPIYSKDCLFSHVSDYVKKQTNHLLFESDSTPSDQMDDLERLDRRQA